MCIRNASALVPGDRQNGAIVAQPQPHPLPTTSPRRILSLVENLYLVQLEEIPGLLRWIELSERAGYMSEEHAWEWRVKVAAWKGWLELSDQHAH